jgi:2-oxo-4-hydroxy-4-carboxy-5-ureidoimidazoline decarboxylase
MKLSPAQINALAPAEFVRCFGSVFEHSPWIAAAAAAQRPFATAAALHQTMCNLVRAAGREKQLALIRAHPDLVGRLAEAGQLTAESRREQADAGLMQLSPDELAQFQRCNAAYQAKFGFPFVICARLNRKSAILEIFSVRLNHAMETEMQIALGEIFKIAELRLRDLALWEE